jgi:type IV pilus assembly protein PilF
MMTKSHNNYFYFKVGCIVGVMFFLAACSTTNARDQDKRWLQAQLYIDLGLRYMEIGNYNVALTKLKKAYALDDENFSSHNALAIFYDTTRKDDLARYHYKRAIVLAPDNPSVLNNYGRFLCQRGDINNGFGMLIKATNLPLNNKLWLTHRNAGQCQVLNGDLVLAENNFLQAIERNDRYGPVFLDLAKLKFSNREFHLARKYLDQFFTVHVETSASVLLAYQIAKQLGHLNATQQYKRVLKEHFTASSEAKSLVK